MGTSTLILNALVIVTAFLVFVVSTRLRSPRPKLAPPPTTSTVPSYSYSVHMKILTGDVTRIPFPCPSPRDPRSKCMITRVISFEPSIRPRAHGPVDEPVIRLDPPVSAKPARQPVTRASTPLPVPSTSKVDGTRRARTQPVVESEDESDAATGVSSRSTSESRESTPTIPLRKGKDRAVTDEPPTLLVRHTKVHESIETAWFQTRSEDTVAAPPGEVTSHPELRYGDIYMHKTPHSFQLWLWERYADGTGGRWKAITQGHQRADGRRLHLTDKLFKPSWVSSEWALRKMREKDPN